jgi:hypothetical protein
VSAYFAPVLLDWLSDWLSVSPRADVPIPSELVSTLKRWKLQCPRSPHDLVFPKLDGSRRSEPAPSTIFARAVLGQSHGEMRAS